MTGTPVSAPATPAGSAGGAGSAGAAGADAGLAAAARALAEGCGTGAADLVDCASPREWVESLATTLPAVAAAAVIEHLFGVLPLVAGFFAPAPWCADVAAGRSLAALGLFTPDPELRWGAVAGQAAATAAAGDQAAAEPAADGRAAGEPAVGGTAAPEAAAGYRLSGTVRLAGCPGGGVLVLVRSGEEHRLAWVDAGVSGVEWHGQGPCRAAMAGAAVGADCVSRPVTVTSGGELWTHLARYASLWGLAASIWARHGVLALRRAARAPRAGEPRWSAAQLVATAVTEVEIEAELAATALRIHFATAAGQAARGAGADGAHGSDGAHSSDGAHGPDGPDGADDADLAIAVGAARALAAVAACTVELRDRLGLAVEGPLADGLPGPLAASLGGVLMLESELAAQLDRLVVGDVAAVMATAVTAVTAAPAAPEDAGR